ncbi:hypothetical protein KXD40_008345 [Peronospora effusa]|uniref:Uncharacterized protein n=1 Tax=Peronospora effusa TaxID=542832 RepID=A0A3M6VIP1_9STRA|nr:hypothetical protein DD238_006027 [Peronospora effusa]RQM13456.1 hypothetical protein DD237_006435 [Peronospora effusa]UIZ24329.1 hypothetical protein KXD40_008345 [Peronospora effusa]
MLYCCGSSKLSRQFLEGLELILQNDTIEVYDRKVAELDTQVTHRTCHNGSSATAYRPKQQSGLVLAILHCALKKLLELCRCPEATLTRDHGLTAKRLTKRNLEAFSLET